MDPHPRHRRLRHRYAGLDVSPHSPRARTDATTGATSSAVSERVDVVTSRITLSPAGAVELELVLTGGLGTPVYGTTGDAGLLPVNGDLGNAAKVELLDEEGTPLAAVVIDGAADENGGRWLRGSVEQLRPFGHLRHRERRIGRDTVRADRAIVVLGDLPLAKDSRWNELDQRMLVLLDTGHHADALSRDVRHAVAAVTGTGAEVCCDLVRASVHILGSHTCDVTADLKRRR